MFACHEYAPFHINANVAIGISDITGAGFGVKAVKFIPKGKVLGRYKGVRLTKKEYLKLKDKSYVFEVKISNHNSVYIDGKDINTSNWTRFINGARTKKQQKMINIDTYQQNKNIYFEAIKDIYPGDELIYDYGSHYW